MFPARCEMDVCMQFRLIFVFKELKYLFHRITTETEKLNCSPFMVQNKERERESEGEIEKLTTK